MEYFMIENGQQTGPFTIDQLAQKHITSETLVWAEGMSNWTPAWQVEQLKYILTGSPQPTPPPYSPRNTQQPGSYATPQGGENQNEAADRNGAGNYTTETAGTGGGYEGTIPPQDNQENTLDKNGKKKNHTPWLIALAILIVALLFFIFTNPSKQDHENAIKNEITTAVEKASNDNQNEETDDLFTQGFSMITKMITGTFFDTALDTLLQYHNYVFFSKTTVHLDGSNHIVSFGILGKVHTINEDDILKVLSKVNPTRIDVQSQSPDQLQDQNDAANQQDDQEASGEGENVNNGFQPSNGQSADQIATRISNKVEKQVEKKIDKEINQVTDSTTIDRLINRVMDMFGIH